MFPLLPAEQETKLFSAPTPPRLNLKYFDVIAKDVMNKQLVSRVRNGIVNGFSANSTRNSTIGFDFSQIEKSKEELDLKRKTVLKFQIQQCAIGPFTQPPFPNSRYPNTQPVIQNSFTIPKDPWQLDPTGEYRMIINASYPRFEGTNGLTPRADSGYLYHHAARFFNNLASAGKNSLISLLDIKNCFPSILFKEEDWAQHIIKVGKEYWVFPGGMLGSVQANDAANCIVHIVVLALRRQNIDINVYVDNFEIITPPNADGSPNFDKAIRQYTIMKDMTSKLGLNMHHPVPPSLVLGTDSIESHLGWGCNTVDMIAFVPHKKRPKILQLMRTWKTKISFSLKDMQRIVGFLNFLAGALGFLRPPLGILMGVMYAYKKK